MWIYSFFSGFDFKEYWDNVWSPGEMTQLKSSLIIIGVLALIFIIAGKRINRIKPEDKPSKIMTMCETLVSIINGFTKNLIGIRWKKVAPFAVTLAIYLTCANLAGLTGVLKPPCSNWNMTLGLAIITFYFIHTTGIRSLGVGKYVKSFFSPNPIFFPINLIGEVTFPMSLSLRLYGNIMSGCVIGILLYGLAYSLGPWGWLLLIAMPFIHLIFDVLFGIIQVAVFTLLSVVFIGQKVDEKELIYE